MASRNLKLIPTILLFSILNHISPLVNADNDPVIDQLCAKTYAPNFCIACCKIPDPPVLAGLATVRTNDLLEWEVVSKLLDCGLNLTRQLQVDTNNAILDPNSDPKIKPAMTQCLGFYDIVFEHWVDVRETVGDGAYTAAKAAVDAYLVTPLTQCATAMKESGGQYPGLVAFGLLDVDTYFNMASEVMVGLKPAKDN